MRIAGRSWHGGIVLPCCARAVVRAGEQGEPRGRLLRYDPRSGQTHVLADGIWFANGIALAADGSYAAVVETVGMRVRRVWLQGEKAGQTDVLLDNLPG